LSRLCLLENQLIRHSEPPASGYGSRPFIGELVAVLAAGAGHVATELALSATAATFYNVGISVAFLGYLVWRVRSTTGVMRYWGFRSDNLREAALAQLPFLVAGVLALAAYGFATGSPGLPNTFWLALVLYPVWGIAQQFALQNLIANNVAGFVPRMPALALLAAVLFAVSHYPRLELVGLTFVAGFFFTWIYRKAPNLWVIGTAHGLLGSMAFYIVLREDPGAVILGFLFG
jgi:hypothetical protein